MGPFEGDPIMPGSLRRLVTPRRALLLVLLGAIAAAAALTRAQSPPALTFVDVAPARGVDVPNRVTRGGVWEDFDGDGSLDLVLGNIFAANQLFLNDGTGHFRDVSE